MVGALAVISTGMFAAISKSRAQPKYHVVFELNEPQGEAWDSVITHIINTREVLDKEGFEAEVVFHGRGLSMLLKKNKAYEERLKQLADSGVKLAACQNTMKFLSLKSGDLFPFSIEVDSGVAELMRKQKAGWQYIH
jgi:intracellular sulfur oxidation DsrE/DsrF family protein